MSRLAPAPAERLAALRLLVGGYAFVYLLVRFTHMIGVAAFTPTQFAPVGPVAILSEPLPYPWVVVLGGAAVIAGAAFVTGYRYRISGPAFAILFLWVTSYRNSWSMIFHTENLLVLHVIVLGLVPAAADAWSLDRRRHGGAAPAPAFAYAWPIELMCAVTVATYFMAGMTKLRESGIAWVTSDTLRYHVAYDNLRKAELGATFSPIGAALAGHAQVFTPIAAMSLLIEVLAPLALLRASIGRAWSYAAWSFHFGVLLVMAIVFHYPLSGIAFASFFAVERIERLSRITRRR